ncbi:MAG: ABC transporter permease [Betaproteobacteria bacterium]
MYLLRLIGKNAFRHKLRTGLTMLGIVIAILAFGMLQTLVNAWYEGANLASATRLVTRNAISLVFSLPLAYKERIRGVEGVKRVTWLNWFGGVYKEPSNFFPQFAADVRSFLEMYPELHFVEGDKESFLRDRRGCIIGTKLAEKYGFKLGDVIPLKGAIYPGTWNFTVRGIYRYEGANVSADITNMYFHWQYLDDTMRARSPRYGGQVGTFIIDIDRPEDLGTVAQAIDATFKNSLAETLTESEKAFNLSFVAMSDQIITIVKLVSFVVVLIIMAVMANTMAMTARERMGEYATLKALGFGPGFLLLLVAGESLFIAFLGCAIGIALTIPVAAGFGKALSTLFPVFRVAPETYALQVGCAAVVGVAAAIVPSIRAATVNVVDGLRSIG